MASKGELYGRINLYQARINECREEINRENKKLLELEELTQKLRNVHGTFNQAQQCSRQRLYERASFLHSLGRISRKIIGSYERNMSELLTGSEYHKVLWGLDAAQDDVRHEMQRRKNRIAELEREIRNLENQIGACHSEIAAIERREREERERAERERREREEREARTRMLSAGKGV